MTLGARLSQWLTDISSKLFAWFQTTLTYKLWKAVIDAFSRRPDDTTEQIIGLVSNLPAPTAHLSAMILATVTGTPLPPDFVQHIQNGQELNKNPGEFMANMVSTFAEHPMLAGAEEALGGLLDGLIVKPLEDALDKGIDDPSEVIRMVHGTQAGIDLAAGVLGLIAEIAGVGQIKTVTAILISMLEGMGLSRIGFRAIAPLMDVGVSEAQKRIYARRYRPYRWTAADLQRLYALREITDAEMRDQMQTLGYRDDDIDKAIRIAEQRISPGDILQAYSLSSVGVDDAVGYLHKAGIAPDDIQFLLQLEDDKRKQQDLASISAIADDAFKKGLVSEARYRQMKAAARVPQERIDLQVEIINLTKKGTSADLKVGEIEQAYKAGILSGQEADHYLLDAGIADDARPILIATWSEQIRPKHLALNAGNITQAYSDGIFDRAVAIKRLEGVGWSPDDATVLLDLADARSIGKVKAPTEGAIINNYTKGLITKDEASALLVQLGLLPEDAALDLQVADLKPKSGTKLLTEAQVVKLVKVGQFSTDDALNYLSLLGYDMQTAQLYLIAELTAVPKAVTSKKG